MNGPRSRGPQLALLLESAADVTPELLRGQRDVPAYVQGYVNTRHGIRPVHHPAGFERYARDLLPWDGAVTLPGADQCYRVPAGTEPTWERVEAARDGSGPLEAWPFERPERVPGLVSVVIPTYQRSRALFAAIESVIAQDGVDFELLVVDDNGEDSGLRDELREVLARAEQNNPHCRTQLLIHEDNLGGAAARNTGTMAARGEFLCFLDDDDSYLPGRLAEAAHALSASSDSVGGNFCGFLGWNSPAEDPGRYVSRGLLLALLGLDYGHHYLHTNTVTYRFDHFSRCNGFDESYRRHQDLELNVRFLQLSTLEPLPQALVRLRPQAPRHDNRLFDRDLYEVKARFLDDFSCLLEAVDEATRERIIEAHRDELLRTLRDPDALRDDDPELRTSALGRSLAKALATARTGSPLPGREADLEAQLQRAQLRTAKLRQRLRQAEERLDSIERSLTWRISRLWRRGS